MKPFFYQSIDNVKLFFSHSCSQIFFITFGIHLIAVIFFSLVSLDLLASTSDHIFYFESGRHIAELFKQGAYHFGDVYPHHWFPLFLGVVFYILTPSMVLGSIMNALITGLSAVLFYHILREYNVTQKISFWSSIIIMNGYMTFMFHSSILLKEAWIVTLLLGVLYVGIRLINGTMHRVYASGLLLLLFILLRNLRFLVGFGAIVGILIGWFLLAQVPLRKKIVGGVALVVCVLGISFSLHGKMIIGSQTVFDLMHIEKLQKTRQSYTNAGGSDTTATDVVIFKPKVESSEGGTSESMNRSGGYTFSVSGYIRSVVSSVIGPFPWQLTAKKYLALLPDTLFIYILLGVSLWGIVRIPWRSFKIIIPWIVTAGIIYGAIALGTDNMGAIVRQRTPAVMVIGLIAAYTYDRKKQI